MPATKNQLPNSKPNLKTPNPAHQNRTPMTHPTTERDNGTQIWWWPTPLPTLWLICTTKGVVVVNLHRPYTRHSCWEHWCWESKSQGTTREGRAGDWWERRIEGGLGCREKLKERESEREADWDWDIYKCKIFYQYFKCKTFYTYLPWLYCLSENILPLTKCFIAK